MNFILAIAVIYVFLGIAVTNVKFKKEEAKKLNVKERIVQILLWPKLIKRN